MTHPISHDTISAQILRMAMCSTHGHAMVEARLKKHQILADQIPLVGLICDSHFLCWFYIPIVEFVDD